MIKVGLLGCGNVGKATHDILIKNVTLLEERIGCSIEIKSFAVRTLEKYSHLTEISDKLTTDVDSILNDPEISIIVEVMGGEYPAFDYICTALKNKKYVVTANKEVISKHKKTFFELAKENNVDIFFEAAVGGGIPIIRSLKVGFAANKIQHLLGILNGTTNYILTKIEEENKDFRDVLKTAQELGLAEADPTMDVAGIDAAHKLVILAAVAFKENINLENVYHEGIEDITLRDMLYAKELGYSIKLLAIGERFKNDSACFRVHPTLIPMSNLLSGIKNEVNAVCVTGNFVGESLLAGKGAGGDPTGSAIVSDIIDIAFDIHHKTTSNRNLETSLNTPTLVSLENTETRFYCRLIVKDVVGVLETISGALSVNGVSILKIIQKHIRIGRAELILVTHTIQEKQFNAALNRLRLEDAIYECAAIIRVLAD
jgi:homoserine dehydrogenase